MAPEMGEKKLRTMDNRKTMYRVAFHLRQGFFAKVTIGAVNVMADLRPLTDQGPAKDSRIYDATVEALKKDGTLNGVDLSDTRRNRLTILSYQPWHSAWVGSSAEAVEAVKK